MGAALETPEGFAVELAEELLKRKAYALVDDDWMLGRHGPIAMDDCAGFD